MGLGGDCVSELSKRQDKYLDNMEKVKIVEQEVKTETIDMVNYSHLDNAMGLPFLSL